MRILHVYKDYAPVLGGIENHVRALAEGQVAAGHDVTVLVTASRARRDDEWLNGVRVLRAARWATLASTPLSLDLVWRLARWKADIVHLHAPYPVAELAWLLLGRGPMILSYHADVVRQRTLMRLWAPGLRRVLARAAHVIAGSPSMADGSPFLAALQPRPSVVPYGIDVHRFRLDPADVAAARERWRDEGAIPPSPPSAHYIVFVGRLRYYKGLHVLLDALPLLPGVRVLVVGSGPMGPALREQAAANGVAHQVRWLGDVSDEDLPAVLAAGDAFVLPASARSEAFGIAMLEAMAAGLPVISTELGTGTSWLNQDRVTGTVVAPNDPEALAAGIRALLEPENRRAELGRSARARAEQHFSSDRMVRDVLAIYETARRGYGAGRAE